ncbi:MAG: DMT family transporter [Burkholderiales bacterium]|jgi:drug/metabolite transporter (DMT)-like permease|nr:DMT family transporter [Burkholderiales bacterium]
MSAPLADAAPARHRTIAFLALITGAAAIAFAPIFVRLSDTAPVASAFWRVALAVPLLWMWAHFAERGAPRHGPLPAKPIVLAGFFFAGDLAVWHVSILFTSVANSTLLANFAPIFVTLGGWLLLKQRVTRLFVAGMVLALAGATVLIGPNLAAGGRALVGDTLGVVTAMFYGAYMLAIASARGSASTAAIMARSTTVTAILLLPLALAMPGMFLPQSAAGWLPLFGLALVCQSGGQSLIAYAMKTLPASFSAVSLLVQPVLATVYAWLILAEPIGTTQAIGAAIILVGIYLARRGS